ncbi:response regulator [Myxococcaceae bacterium GXIMD 01537]
MDTSWTLGRCLLLVEDDASNRMTLSALLEDAGFAVITASSYTEAAGLLQRPGGYDAVLLDQGLGDGQGTDLVPLVRRVLPRARLVFVTGGDSLPRVPVDGVFRKGAHFDDLLVFLWKLLPQPSFSSSRV